MCQSSVPPVLFQFVVYLISEPLVFGVLFAVFHRIDLLIGGVEGGVVSICIGRMCDRAC